MVSPNYHILEWDTTLGNWDRIQSNVIRTLMDAITSANHSWSMPDRLGITTYATSSIRKLLVSDQLIQCLAHANISFVNSISNFRNYLRRDYNVLTNGAKTAFLPPRAPIGKWTIGSKFAPTVPLFTIRTHLRMCNLTIWNGWLREVGKFLFGMSAGNSGNQLAPQHV